jgi:hypothetical protein
MGSIMLGLGKTDAAIEEYKRAHAVLRQLAVDEPQSDTNRANLALILTTLGNAEHSFSRCSPSPLSAAITERRRKAEHGLTI